MSFFPATLYVNPITGLLSAKPSHITGIVAKQLDPTYHLTSCKGVRAIYTHSTGYTMVVVDAGMGNYKQYASI